MNDWGAGVESALRAFITVAELAGDPISRSELEVEFLHAPHCPPARLPAGKMAVYGFWFDGSWLKIGKAGPYSNARYTSQHYRVGSARSTLAGSLVNDPQMLTVEGFDPLLVGDWIKRVTCRVNILMPRTRRRELLSLLEAFLHLCLRPRYEG